MRPRNFPKEYIPKIEDIKKIILIRSKLLSEHGRNVKIELEDYDYDRNKDIFYELVFYISLNNVDCGDCDFEVESLASVIQEIKDQILKGASFKLTSNLDVVSGNTTRGVLLSDIDYGFTEFKKLSFNLFIDPGNEY